MADVIVAGKSRSGRPSKFSKGYLEGGPEMLAKLQQLEKNMRDELLASATLAGAEVIAEEWRARVRAQVGLGPGIAHYAESIQAQSKPGRTGATGLVSIEKNVPTAEGEDEPRAYARKLEFGSWANGRVSQAHPMARPAFDSAKQRALDAMAEQLRKLLFEGIG